MIIDVGYWTRVLKKIVIVIAIIAGLYFCFKLSIFYIPFLIAFLVAILIEPVIRFVRDKTTLTRKVSAIIVMGIISITIIGLLVWGIIILIQESSNLLEGLNGYYEKINSTVQGIINDSKIGTIQLPAEVMIIVENSSSEVLTYISNWVEGILTSFLDGVKSIPVIAIYIGVTLLAIYFMCADRIYILDQIEHHMPRMWVKRMGKHLREIIETLGSFLKAEVILVAIAFVQVLIGLYIIKFMGMNIEYPLLAALVIAFVDALPILGSGTIMIPWAILVAINGDFKLGIALLILWLVIIIMRQIIEPKVVSKQIGIHPIFTLIAMYTGFKLIGIIGLIIGPIALMILKNVFGTFIDKGVFKTIFDRK